jgi:hypothetical protein
MPLEHEQARWGEGGFPTSGPTMNQNALIYNSISMFDRHPFFLTWA